MSLSARAWTPTHRPGAKRDEEGRGLSSAHPHMQSVPFYHRTLERPRGSGQGSPWEGQVPSYSPPGPCLPKAKAKAAAGIADTDCRARLAMSCINITDLAFSSQHVHVNLLPKPSTLRICPFHALYRERDPRSLACVASGSQARVDGARISASTRLRRLNARLVFKDLAGTKLCKANRVERHPEHKAQGRDSSQSVLPAPRDLGHVPASSRITSRYCTTECIRLRRPDARL